MNIGMLWNGSDIASAKKYFIEKYGKIPDAIEMSPLFLKIFEVKGGMLEGMKVYPRREIQNGNILIGMEKDTKLEIKEEK